MTVSDPSCGGRASGDMVGLLTFAGSDMIEVLMFVGSRTGGPIYLTEARPSGFGDKAR